MKNKFKSIITQDYDETFFPKSPIIVGIALIYLATIYGQGSDNLALNASIEFTILMIIQLLLYLFSRTIFKDRYWLYFTVQAIITLSYAATVPRSFETILIGLIPLFVIQSMIIYNDAFKVIITAILFYGIYCSTIIISSGFSELIKSTPILIIITISIRAYSIIFFNQVKLRIQSQKVLKELELAYEKVEELTIANERQRMARDLHDTLSQGLAGIIMQLDAINANLNNNNIKRAQEIVQKSMEHARKTLADSRLVINDLRSQIKDDIDFYRAIENEITTFKNVSNISILKDIRLESQIPLNIAKHTLYIVREALNNIAKHSKAQNAVVKIIESNNKLNIDISDDGVGFDTMIIDKMFGHYGILGMNERIRAVMGEIKIKSNRKLGTSINIVIPIVKGIDDVNE